MRRAWFIYSRCGSFSRTTYYAAGYNKTMETPEPSPTNGPKLDITADERAAMEAWIANHPYGEQDENGIDLSTIRRNLRLTPTERLRRGESGTNSLQHLKGSSKTVNFFGTIQRLDAQGVCFVIIGGTAMNLHGTDNVALNFDICVGPNPLHEGLAKWLATQNVRVVMRPEGTDNFEGLWERAVVMEIDEKPVRVASIPDLIAMKRAADRPKDQTHIMQLQALEQIIDENKPG